MDNAFKTPTLRELGFYSEAEVAAIYSVAVPTLRNWRTRDTGPAFTRLHRRQIVYPVNAIREHLQRNTVKPGRRP